MTDEQVHARAVVKRLVVISIILFLLAGGLAYYWYSNAEKVKTYYSQQAREGSLRSQVAALEETNNNLRSTIEQTGKELVSFSENKIMYINLASEMSQENDVKINKLTVSDVWEEGTMAGMTTCIEVEGTLDNVRGFINSYCGINYTNRINVVSCRPIGRFPWFSRSIDGEQILTWLDLSYEEGLYEAQRADRERELSRAAAEAGIPVADILESEEGETSITLEQMFEDKTFKAYLEIDFLGRQ